MEGQNLNFWLEAIFRCLICLSQSLPLSWSSIYSAGEPECDHQIHTSSAYTAQGQRLYFFILEQYHLLCTEANNCTAEKVVKDMKKQKYFCSSLRCRCLCAEKEHVASYTWGAEGLERSQQSLLNQ